MSQADIRVGSSRTGMNEMPEHMGIGSPMVQAYREHG